MTPDEIHEWIVREWRNQCDLVPEPAPPNVSKNDWKNRRRVTAKLRPENYSDLMVFCREHDFSVNSGLNSILSFFFHQLKQ